MPTMKPMTLTAALEQLIHAASHPYGPPDGTCKELTQQAILRTQHFLQEYDGELEELNDEADVLDEMEDDPEDEDDDLEFEDQDDDPGDDDTQTEDDDDDVTDYKIHRIDREHKD